MTQNYIMVGAGGTGTHLLTPLITYLRVTHTDNDWMLHIIDGDVVEQKNLERQLFVPTAVTMNKAEAAALPYNDPDHIKTYPFYLSEDNIDRLINEDDIVFLCVDNFTVRKRVENKAATLKNIVIINGGNEAYDGSVQLWVREKNENITPTLSYLHPELKIDTVDRAEMTCVQAAALPGGEQTIIANMHSATWMMTALWRYHTKTHVLKKTQQPSHKSWTELQFDARNGVVEHIDQRISKHWKTA